MESTQANFLKPPNGINTIILTPRLFETIEWSQHAVSFLQPGLFDTTEWSQREVGFLRPWSEAF